MHDVRKVNTFCNYVTIIMADGKRYNRRILHVSKHHCITLIRWLLHQDRLHLLKRRYSSRMHTTRLPTVSALVASRCQYWYGGVLCPMSGRGGPKAGGSYSDVQSIMGKCHLGPPPLWTDWQTDIRENIPFLQLRWWAVKNRNAVWRQTSA